MGGYQRRWKILTEICKRRHDTCENLANEFGVTARTIQTDIQILSCSYPIECIRGRFGGGVRIADWFTLKSGLTDAQLSLLQRLSKQLKGNDLHIMESIITRYAPA